MKKLDRYLISRNGNFHYHRKVPAGLQNLDPRFPLVRKSLKTDNVFEARAKRDRLEVEDNHLWKALEATQSATNSREIYEASLRMQAVHKSKVPAIEENNFGDMVERFQEARKFVEAANDKYYRALANGDTLPDEKDPTIVEAAKAWLGHTGAIPKPKGTISEAFEVYVDKIAAPDIAEKSPNQKRGWLKIKRRSVENFKSLFGDIELLSVTREQAVSFRDWWRDRMENGEVGYSTANRDLTNMRVLFDAYSERMQQHNLTNPFSGLRFKEPKTKRRARRVSFSTEWLSEHFLQSDKLAKLNAEARHILLILIETGCRPSEIINLRPENIRLSDNIPHIRIRYTEDREIKTAQSERDIPLTGVALEAMRHHPNGFERYRDKEDTFSAAVNKYLRENGLRETPEHTVYCIRHTFEDRMKKAKFDSEMRAFLAGHKLSRSEYGEGFDLEDKHTALNKIALPFDNSIV